MKCRLLAAGTRLPEWVNTGFREYQKRLRAPLVLELEEIPVAARGAGENPERAVAREGRSIDRKSTRLNSSHSIASRMPSSA